MHTISIDFEDEAIAHWTDLAQTSGQRLEDIIREAILDRLEELEDAPLVRARLAEDSETIPNEEVWAQLRERADKD